MAASHDGKSFELNQYNDLPAGTEFTVISHSPSETTVQLTANNNTHTITHNDASRLHIAWWSKTWSEADRKRAPFYLEADTFLWEPTPKKKKQEQTKVSHLIGELYTNAISKTKITCSLFTLTIILVWFLAIPPRVLDKRDHPCSHISNAMEYLNKLFTTMHKSSFTVNLPKYVNFLYTDNQAAEHIATQPNMNEHSRSIDIRHHAIRQDYIDGMMRIGGVATGDNTSDILTKYLQPPLHIKHTSHLHINTTNSVTNTHTSLQSHVTHATLKQHTSVGIQTCLASTPSPPRIRSTPIAITSPQVGPEM
jgi:hypothetical protein